MSKDIILPLLKLHFGESDLTENEYIIDCLKKLDEYYFEESSPLVTDEEYDMIRRFAQAQDPTNPYFIGIGSKVRKDAVKLPYNLGSLNEVHAGDLSKWVKKWKLENDQVVITDKLDGVSCLLIYTASGILQIAYTRGDGYEGSDITRHIKHLVPIYIEDLNQPLAIRAEVIISKENFLKLQPEVKSRSGKEYKNPRNMVSGLLNAKQNDSIVYPHMNLIGYEIMNIPMSKVVQLQTIDALGFETPHFKALLGKHLNDDELSQYHETRRDQSKYEIDGLVIDVDSLILRNEIQPTRDTLNPEYSVKFKIRGPQHKQYEETFVTGVEWNVSKHGYIKPVILVEPVNMGGVTISRSTGFNAAYILENKIHPGTKIMVTRKGDVIPYCMGVIEPGPFNNDQFQSWFVSELSEFGDYTWSENSVDVILENASDNKSVILKQLEDFFTSIDIAMLKEGTLVNLDETLSFSDFTASVDTLVSMNRDQWLSIVGKNGLKIYESLQEKRQAIDAHILLGAVPFFDRGIGARKFKTLIRNLSINTLDDLSSLSEIDIVLCDQFEEKSARKVVNGMANFMDFYNKTNFNMVFENKPKSTNIPFLVDQKIVFTGFRDKKLQMLVENNGGSVQSAVSGKTTLVVALNSESSSGKVKKAREKGIEVVSLEKFQLMLQGESNE